MIFHHPTLSAAGVALILVEVAQMFRQLEASVDCLEPHRVWVGNHLGLWSDHWLLRDQVIGHSCVSSKILSGHEFALASGCHRRMRLIESPAASSAHCRS